MRLLFMHLLLDLYLYVFITCCYCPSVLFGADSRAIDGTCPEALFPTEGAAARVHQVSKVSPACRSLIQCKFHGFGNSENDKKTSHHNTEHNNKHFLRTETDVGDDVLRQVRKGLLSFSKGRQGVKGKALF